MFNLLTTSNNKFNLCGWIDGKGHNNPRANFRSTKKDLQYTQQEAMELGFNCFEERKIECKRNLLIFYSSSLLRMTGFMKIFSPIRLSFMGANTRPNTKYIRQLICFIFLSNYLKVCWTLSLLSMWLSHPPGQYQFICLINPCNEFKSCLSAFHLSL